MNSFTEESCANFLASLNMSDAGIIPFDFAVFDEIITESMYDSIFEYDNPARKGSNRKAKGNGKRNADKVSRLHKADRYHGKGLEPYLYKEDGVIKESIEWVWRDCRMPVSDRVHAGRSALKAEAREKDFFFNPSPMEMELVKAEEKQEASEVGFYDFLWYLIDTLPEGKYIMLYNYDNGMSYEDHDYAVNQFLGVKTKDEIIVKLTEEFLRHEGVNVNKTKVQGLNGIEFNWDFEDNWSGYEDFTIIPLSNI